MKRWYYVVSRAFSTVVLCFLGGIGLANGAAALGSVLLAAGIWLGVVSAKHYKKARQGGPQDQDSDNWEGSFWDIPQPRTVTARLRLKYVDGKGQRTTREVSVRQYGEFGGAALIIADCHLRNATRTFRTDRVKSCIDLDTGEVVADLHRWLNARWEASPDRAIEKVVSDYWDLMKVLYYVAKADGRLMKAERQVLHRAVSELSGRTDLASETIDTMLDGLRGGSVTGFKQAFGRLANSRPDTAAAALTWSEQIVATDKSVSPGEKEAIDYMRKRLQRAR